MRDTNHKMISIAYFTLLKRYSDLNILVANCKEYLKYNNYTINKQNTVSGTNPATHSK